MPPFDAGEARVPPVTLSNPRSDAEAAPSRTGQRHATRERELAARERGARSLATCVHALAAVGRQRRFQPAAMALCNEVAGRWQAARVAFGLVQGDRVRCKALSRTDRIDPKVALVRSIEDAMDEAVDQAAEVAWPAPADAPPVVARAARILADRFGPHRVLALPLADADGRPAACLLVEFPADATPAAEALDGLRLLSTLSAPLLLRQAAADRPLWRRAGSALTETVAVLTGPRHTGARLLGLVALAVLLFLALVPAPYRIQASVLVQASDRQVVAAPFAGYLGAVLVRPGDRVVAGETVLARLETSELRLRLASLLAEREGHVREARLAERNGETAQARIARARADQVGADIDLLRHRIARATLTAPVTGVVLEGDRRQEVGSAVERGMPLFQVAGLDGLHAELSVPENRIADLAVGQRGLLATAARPDRPVPLTITRIGPMAAAGEGGNSFTAWATLAETPPFLRPGMAGVARVRAGEASRLWLWTRDAVDWLRMRLWW